MNEPPAQISLEQWHHRYTSLRAAGFHEAPYGGPLERHFTAGDYRLAQLRFDNSAAALRLWNFLLTETERLFAAQRAGKKIIGTMKDLGTVPIMAYALPDTIAFYPDGTWWIPCIMRQSTRDLAIADSLGIDESFCPVRAMLGAFETHQHFPPPDLLICSVGATCDDFSAIAQRLASRGLAILWWEIPARRTPEPTEEAIALPGGFLAGGRQVDFVQAELQRVSAALAKTVGHEVTDARLAEGITAANRIRDMLRQLRNLVFTAPRCPLPALEMLIAEMLAIHYCSDRQQTQEVLGELLAEVLRRIAVSAGTLPADAVRVFWVNPVADLQAMNLLEECGGRLCGTEFMFCHALDPIPTDVAPMEALARMALADPMIGPSADRAKRIMHDVRQFGAEAVLISRIPGASHCALEGSAIRAIIQRESNVPVVEIEVPPLNEGVRASLRTRLEALVETVRRRRTS